MVYMAFLITTLEDVGRVRDFAELHDQVEVCSYAAYYDRMLTCLRLV